jgi:hypothetical protein
MQQLEVGVISDPVQSEFGFHIIRVTERSTTPFEEAEQQIYEQLAGPMQDEAWNEFVKQAYEDADVEIDSRYGVLDIASGQILDPDASDLPAAQRPKAEQPEEQVDVPAPGEGPASPQQ